MKMVALIVKIAVLAALIVAAPLSASSISGKIANVQRAVAAAAERPCPGGDCTLPVNRDKLDCLAAVAHCASALAAILPSMPALQPRVGAAAVATEQTGCTVHTTLTDPPPPRACVI